MRITFWRIGRGCAWTALRPPRSIVPGPTMAAGGDLPHDLYHFVIEDALDLDFGFWGCVAHEDGCRPPTLERLELADGTTTPRRSPDFGVGRSRSLVEAAAASNTVQDHLKAVFHKIGVHSRRERTAYVNGTTAV
jgi:hypothetical protein